jgi:hypothetical protein
MKKKTGGIHEAACMLLQLVQLLLLRRACVRGCPRDRHHVSADLQLGADPAGHGESNFPELVLLTVPNFREYFYTKIRFSTPALSALLGLVGHLCPRLECGHKLENRVI